MKKDNKQYTLEEILRKKLENHQVEADLSDWDAIHKRLPKYTSRTIKWVWVCTSIAASIILFLISLHIPDQNQESKPLTQDSFPIQQENKIAKQENKLTASRQENITDEIVSPKQNIPARLTGNLQAPKKTDSLSTLLEISKGQEIELNKQPEPFAEAIENNAEKTETIDFYQQKTSYTPIINSKKNSKKKPQKWILTSSLATNKALPDKLQYDYPKKGNNMGSELWAGWGGGYPSNSENDHQIDKNVDVKHLPPFSFGLTIKKQLNQRLGLETGLIYTYLSSTYKWHEKKSREATQQLHYIGVPINGIVALWDNSKWSNYVSVGVTMEKGIRKNIIGDNLYSLLPSTNNQSKSINGLQWSIGSSIGFNYHFSKKVSIYFEPRIGYYFKNNQPKSIRTDCPVSAGFGMGIQYSL